MSSENTKKSVKQRLLALQGQKAPIDLFLFACWEQEKTLKALSQPPKSKTQRAPAFAPVSRGWNAHLNEPLVEQGEAGFMTAWDLCCRWYQNQFPDLFTDATFDHEYLALLIAPTVDLVKDLCRIYKHCHSEDLPLFPSLEQKDQQQPVAKNIWNFIEKTMGIYFKSSSDLIMEYLRWSFREEVVETFEPGSRPPVGRFAPPPPRREFGFGAKGGKNRELDRKNSSKERFRPGQKQEQAGNTSQKTRTHPLKNRKNNASQGDSRRHERKSKQKDDDTNRNTELVLAEVEKALEKFRQQPDLKEIKLTPQNSFYRRIQHQKIVDAGFISQSEGEGPDRAVTIQRQ
jgi:hypothetical protein